MREIRFRDANSNEKSTIHHFFRKNFGIKALQPFKDMEFFVKEGKVIEVYAVPKNNANIIHKMPINVYSAGIPLGTIVKGEFQLEIEGGLVVLPFTDKIIEVKTDQYLYGKNIYIENVKKVYGNFEKGDTVIILGKNGLHYGVGIALYSSWDFVSLKPNTVIIRGKVSKPFDRGWYLRKGG